MSRKFDDATVAFARLAYPYYSNTYLAEKIGCSVVWMEKLSQKYQLKKAGNFTIRGDQCDQKDLIGEKFVDLVVIDRLGKKQKNNIVWKCQCKCGKIINVRSKLLRSNKVTECRICKKKNKKEESQKRFDIENKQKRWFWSKLQSHAFERGIDVEIDFNYTLELFVKQNKKCALTGIELEFPYIKNNRKYGNGSLDRIDSSKGYISGNVRWILKDVNIMRNNHTDEIFIDLCCKVADYYRNHTDE